LGKGVEGFRRGDKVMFYGFHTGTQNQRQIIGTLAEQVVVPVANLLHQPEGIGDAEALLFRASYETAYHALQVGRPPRARPCSCSARPGERGSPQSRSGRRWGQRS
jgi:NADPH:quinone reductase-like Zn-dependent oxidoreductase